MDWDKYFFSDVGKKIKNIIRGIFYTEVVLLLITGVILEIAALVKLIMEGDGEFFLIMLGIPVGVVLAIGSLWLSTLLTYGFAEIVDTAIVNRHSESKEMPKQPQPQTPMTSSTTASEEKKTPTPRKDPRAFSVGDYWVCTLCDSKNLKLRKTCWACDAPRPAQSTEEVEEDGWTCPRCEGDLERDKTGDVWFCPDCKKQYILKDGFFPRMIEI